MEELRGRLAEVDVGEVEAVRAAVCMFGSEGGLPGPLGLSVGGAVVRPGDV